MGNPDFAVPSLQSVSSSSHKIIAIISNPPKKIGRGKKIKETAIGISAKAMKIPLLQPPNLRDRHFLQYVWSMRPDIFVVVAFKILPDRLLSIPKYGAINLHPSLLPKYRGAAPIQWSLLNGDTRTAVTTILLSKQIDSGNILLQESININHDDNYGTLSKRLSKVGANLIVKTINEIEKNTLKGIPQDESKVTFAPKIKSDDYKIKWSKSAKEIQNHIRAFSPSPGALTIINTKRIKIYSSSILDNKSKKSDIGEIVICNTNQLVIQTGKGMLEICDVQLEGKKRMTVAEYLRGAKLQPNMIIGK